MLKYFKGSFIVAAVGLILGYLLGGPTGLFITAILAVLEVSLSFDNAIVNAKELETMEPIWQQRFLTWGMAIAVFGMRVLFPLLIVCIVAKIGPLSALQLAMFEPETYKTTLTSAHTSVMGFGGAFLFMVFLKFFLDSDKEDHWFEQIEHKLAKLGVINTLEAGIILTLTIFVSMYLESVHGIEEAYAFMKASVWGIVVYIAVDVLHHVMGEEDDSGAIVRTGLTSLIYLEILDSSFSFDGVIGAFAITTNIFIMAIGLGIGAMFVRSMTLMLVDKGTLAQYQYLEHGAFWAIGSLATIMFYSTIHEVSEIVTGGLGAAFILSALYASIQAKKSELATA